MSEENSKKHKRNSPSKLRADLELNFLLAEIEGRLKEPSEELVRGTTEGVRAAIRKFDAMESGAAKGAASGALSSFVVNRLSDLISALSRLALVKLDVGVPAELHADSRPKGGAGGKSTASQYCTWKQDDLLLTLSCLSRKPYTVILHIDEGPDLELSEVRWVDEDSLNRDPEDAVSPTNFPLERIDERTYRVDMRVGVFAGRMGSLTAARERESDDGMDPRLLLPFVN